MKFVLLAMFVLVTAQPLKASACDMHNGQEPTDSPAANMHDGPMDHGEKAMDCCDQDPETPGGNCDSMSHCGACPTSLVGITPYTANMLINPGSRLYIPVAGAPLSRTGSPPFRPPIV